MGRKNKNKKKKIFLKVFLESIILVVFLLGIFCFIRDQNYQKEMRKLEEYLNEKEKMILEYQKEYSSIRQKEQEELESSLEEIKKKEKEFESEISSISIVGVGDSVMLGAVSNLSKKFPNGHFDAKVSRSIWAAHDILLDLKNKNTLNDPIVLNLGANGDCSKKCKNEILAVCGDRKVFWVTVTNDSKVHVNDKLKELAKQRDNLFIIDWEEISKNHEEYFYADGIHLTSKGRAAYTNAIYDAVKKEMLKKFQEEQEKIQKEYDEKQRDKVSFYGTSIFFYSFDLLMDNFPNQLFDVNLNMSYDDLKKSLETAISENRLSKKIVLSFDRDSNLKKSEYEEIIKLCGDSDIYILKTTNDTLEFEQKNVHVIDFYQETKEHKEYLLKDKIHLSKEGNEAFISSLKKELIEE